MKRLALLLMTMTGFATSGHAAPLDMNTQTCQDWLDAGEDEQDEMVAWLRGYVAGHAAGALFDDSRVRADALTLKRFCQGHLNVGLVSAASAWGR
jgi:uncharacterized protein YdaL